MALTHTRMGYSCWMQREYLLWCNTRHLIHLKIDSPLYHKETCTQCINRKSSRVSLEKKQLSPQKRCRVSESQYSTLNMLRTFKFIKSHFLWEKEIIFWCSSKRSNKTSLKGANMHLCYHLQIWAQKSLVVALRKRVYLLSWYGAVYKGWKGQMNQNYGWRISECP